MSKRQFKTRLPKRSFFDRKVTHSGASRILSLSKVIPKEWEYVRITIIDNNTSEVTMKLTRLQMREAHAQTTTANPTGQPDA